MLFTITRWQSEGGTSVHYLCVHVGDKGAGKSTLTKALTTEKTTIVRWTGRVSKVSGVKERTAGIETHTVHSSQIGHRSIYDLAGHREFHNAHDTVIRSSI